ncbi:MAG: response regulator transcription factor [Elusimicrobiota bacterium]
MISGDGRKKRVVIFEDNPSIQQLLKFFFQKRGYVAAVFEDGVDAVANIQAHSPALIMMDLIMPGKDGIEACADIRRAGITTPILMLTSKAIEADRERALAAGANGYLLKPFNPTDLEAALSSLLA